MLDVSALLAGRESSERSEGFDFEHVGVGEGFKIASAIGVDFAFEVFEGFYKKRVSQSVSDPTGAMRQADFRRRKTGALAEREKVPPDAPPGIAQVGVGPEDH